MRDIVISKITEAAYSDKDIMFLSADLGAPALDEFRKNFPDQFVHTGIAEQHMIDLAAGLALAGKKVFCYAMAPFMPARCYEQIKCSLSAMNLPVTLIGVGVGLGYDHTSMTHIQVEDIALMRTLNHVEIWTPSDDFMAEAMILRILDKPALRYLRLERQAEQDKHPVYSSRYDAADALDEGSRVVCMSDGPGAIIFTSGSLLGEAADASIILDNQYDLETLVIDVPICKPLDPGLLKHLDSAFEIFIVEEHVICGGLGSAIVDLILDQPFPNNVLEGLGIYRLGLRDGYSVVNGDRKVLRRHFGLDSQSIVKKVLSTLQEGCGV